MRVPAVIALLGFWGIAAEDATASSPVLLAMGRPGGQVLVATSSGALAALDLETGATNWAREAAVEGGWAMLRSEAGLAIAGGTAGTVRAWETATGEPAWQRDSLGPVLDFFFAAGPLDAAGRQGHILGGEALLLALAPDGAPWWSARAQSPDGPLATVSKWRGAAMQEGGSTLCVLAEETDKSAAGFSVVRFDVDSGKVVGTVPLPAEAAAAAAAGNVLVAGETLAYIAGEKLGVHPLCGDSSGQYGEPEVFDLKAVRLRPPGSNWLTPWMQTHGLFGGTNGHFTFIFKAGSSVAEGLKLAWINNAVGASGPIHAGDQDGGLALPGHMATAVPRKELYEVRVTSIDGTSLEPFSVPRDYSGRGEMRLVVGKELSPSERRWVLSAADGSIAVVAGADRFLWVREAGTISQGGRKEL